MIEEENRRRNEFLEEAIRDGDKIEEMEKTLGWKLIEQELTEKLVRYGEQLLNAEEPIRIGSLQGQMKEIRSILSFGKIKKEHRKEAIQAIKEQEEK